MKQISSFPARALLLSGAAWLVFLLLVSPALPTDPTSESALPAEETASPPLVVWVKYHGVIGSVSSNFLVDAIAEAESREADALVIEMDTPGGLDMAMRDIIKKILSSKVPVIFYVSPSGSRAASAGAFIAIASHAVAMAPGTNVGAAHPVSIGGGQADSTITNKATNDAVAYIRSIADERGRDADWAERAVRQSVSASAEEALDLGIADCIAKNRDELFEKLDGFLVETAEGERALRLRDATVEEFAMSGRYRFLNFLNDPNIAYILLMLGFYGLFFEISSPGHVFPGVLGGICLILGLFALRSFSINYAGLLLMVLGLIFFILELVTPTFGALTAGGVVSLALGSILLFDSPAPFLRVSLKVLVPTLVMTAGFFAFAAAMAIRTRQKRPTTGRRGLRGKRGVARTPIDPKGKVFVDGSHWTARSETPIDEGAEVTVEDVDGLVLTVRPADPERKDD